MADELSTAGSLAALPEESEPEEYISGRQLAERCGVSEASIRKARGNGRIQSYDPATKKYRYPAARDEFVGFRDPAKVRGSVAAAGAVTGQSGTAAQASAYQGDKARFERARADKMEIEARILRNELVPRAQVESEARRAGLTIKQRLMLLTDRLAPDLAAETELVRVIEILDRAFRGVLEEVADECSLAE